MTLEWLTETNPDVVDNVRDDIWAEIRGWMNEVEWAGSKTLESVRQYLIAHVDRKIIESRNNILLDEQCANEVAK